MSARKLPSPDQWRPSGAQTPAAREGFGFSEARKALIRRLETLRESKVIVYVESGDPPPDALRYLYEHLRSAHRETHRQLDLILFTRNPSPSDLERALQMAALLREHAREVRALVPSLACGLGTCLAVGVDQIAMHPLATLGRLHGAAGLASLRHFEALLAEAPFASPEPRDATLRAFFDAAGPEALAQARYDRARLVAGLQALINHRVRSQAAEAASLVDLLDDPACPLAHPFDRRQARALLGVQTEPLDLESESILWDLFCAYEHPLALLDPGDRAHTPDSVIESEGACHCHTPAQGKNPQASGWSSVVGSKLH